MDKSESDRAEVAIIMGSRSDWPTMKLAADMLDQLGVTYKASLVSAHRTPHRLVEFASTASEHYKVVIAGTAYAAHLPGMTASFTDIPVIGVPIESKSLKGLDSLLSIVQMPKGIPVGTCAIGEAGAVNAGIYAAKIIALMNPDVAAKVAAYRRNLAESIPTTVED